MCSLLYVGSQDIISQTNIRFSLEKRYNMQSRHSSVAVGIIRALPFIKCHNVYMETFVFFRMCVNLFKFDTSFHICTHRLRIISMYVLQKICMKLDIL